MQRADWAQVKIPHGQGIFFTCGCYACQFDRNDGDGYGLAAIRNPGGPAAVIGASEESYAAMGTLALDGLFHRFSAPLFARPTGRLLAGRRGRFDHRPDRSADVPTLRPGRRQPGEGSLAVRAVNIWRCGCCLAIPPCCCPFRRPTSA